MESSEEETTVPSTTTRGNVLDEDNTLLAALIESDQLGPVFKETFGSNKAQEARMVSRTTSHTTPVLLCSPVPL